MSDFRIFCIGATIGAILVIALTSVLGDEQTLSTQYEFRALMMFSVGTIAVAVFGRARER